jgi:hypothetical protein
MSTTFTDDDVGKPVETVSGNEIGIVASVEGTTASVELEPSTIDVAKTKFGREIDQSDPLVLDADDVRSVTSETIYLAEDPSSQDDRSESGDESRSGTALEPNEEKVGETGGERHPDAGDAPAGNRTATGGSGEDKNR